MAPKKQQSKSEGGGQKKENKKGGNKTTTSPNGDDDCVDMPPLEDMRKSDPTGNVNDKGTGGGKKKNEGTEEVKLPEPRWSQGLAPRGLAFLRKDVGEAYRMVEIDPASSDEKVYLSLDEKVEQMNLGEKSKHGTIPEVMGAILLIAASRVTADVNFLLPIIQRIYVYEANQYLSKLELPLPRDLPHFDSPNVMEVTYDRSMSSDSRGILMKLQSLHAADKTRLDNAEKEAKESKGNMEKMKTELVEYKAEVKEGFKARDEKASELEKVKTEKEEVKRELEKRDEENAKLKEELAKLRASSSSSTSSQVASSDKTSFVIKSLSRQVKDLGRQVKDKNDQLGESLLALYELV
ncbi:hypothetical protein JCM5353_001634 [Sporobolomyces roseus]